MYSLCSNELQGNLIKRDPGTHENMSEDRKEKKRAANRPNFFKFSKYLMSNANKYLKI